MNCCLKLRTLLPSKHKGQFWIPVSIIRGLTQHLHDDLWHGYSLFRCERPRSPHLLYETWIARGKRGMIIQPSPNAKRTLQGPVSLDVRIKVMGLNRSRGRWW